MAETVHDVIIVGAGPAGLGAGLYTARDRLNTIMIEKFMPGGQIATTDRIENYPGFDRIDGPGLVEKLQKQVESFGAHIQGVTQVTGMEKQADSNIAVVCGDKRFVGRAVILAPGSTYRHLDIPGEDTFHGSGVSYCGTCDAPFFRDKEVVCVGGGNTAVEETLHLCKYASQVTMIHRREEFRAAPVLVEELLAKAEAPDTNLTIKYNTIPLAVQGDKKVDSIKLKNVKTEAEEDFACEGVFVFVGHIPNTDFLTDALELTDLGFIKCDPAYLRTSMPGVFVAGDCRAGAAMQLVTAVADGVNAAIWLKEYYRDPTWWNEPAADMLVMNG
ncbi:NAD(P)/FAD-dependent oxidoreductase [Planctomycetota bacterium]